MKKRLMAFLLVLVMVIGMLPTTVLADDYGEIEDQNNQLTQVPGWWSAGAFMRVTVSRFDGATNMAGFDVDGMTQSKMTSQLVNAAKSTSTYSEVIVDVVNSRTMNKLLAASDIAVTDNSAMEYRAGSYDKAYLTDTTEDGSIIRVNDNHIIISADELDYDIGTANGSLNFPWSSITELMTNNNSDEYLVELADGIAFNVGDAYQIGEYVNSHPDYILYKLQDLMETYDFASDIRSDMESDADLHGRGDCYVASAFYSATKNDDYAYLLTVEDGFVKHYSSDGTSATVENRYAMATLRDNVFGWADGFNKVFGHNGVGVSGNTSLAKAFYFDERGPVLADEALKGEPIYTDATADALWDVLNSKYTSSNVNQIPSSSSNFTKTMLNETGMGMLGAFGRLPVGAPSTRDSSISISKNFISNLPDSYFTEAFGEGTTNAGELAFPVTVTISGLTYDENDMDAIGFDAGRQIWVWASPNGENGGIDNLYDGYLWNFATVESDGTVTFDGYLYPGRDMYITVHAPYDDVADAYDGYSRVNYFGIFEDELDNVTITIEERLGKSDTSSGAFESYADGGMMAVAFKGDKPYGYEDMSNASSMPYAQDAHYATMVASHTSINSTDGFAMSDEDGYLEVDFTNIEEGDKLTVDNMWVGVEAKKVVEGNFTSSEYLKTTFANNVSWANTNLDDPAFWSYYADTRGLDHMWPLQFYFAGYTRETDAAGWASTCSSGNTFGSIYASEQFKLLTHDDNGTHVFGYDEVGALVASTNSVYFYPRVEPNQPVLMVDPAFGLHAFIAGQVGGFGFVGVSEMPGAMIHLAAETGGTDTTDATFFKHSVSNNYLHDVSTSPNVSYFTGGSKLNTKTLDEQAKAYLGGETSSAYTAWKDIAVANDPDSLTEAGAYAVYGEYAMDLFGNRDDGVEGGVVYYGSTITNSFSTDSNGVCHLIIDLNLNGQPIYEVTSESGTIKEIDAASKTIECGVFGEGDTITFSNINIQPVTFTVKNTGGNDVTVTATPKGIYDKASGGNKVTSYTITHTGTEELTEDGDLHVLFVQWDFTTSISGTTDNPGDTSTPPTTPGTSNAAVEDSQWHTVYWDYGYTGGGVTSTQVGVIKHFATQEMEVGWTIDVSCSCTSARAHTEVDSVKVTKYAPYLITYQLDVPARPERQGWTFLGWVNEGTTENTWMTTGPLGSAYNAFDSADFLSTNGLEKVMRDGGQGATLASVMNEGKFGQNYNDNWRVPYAEQMKDQLSYIDAIQAVIDAKGEGRNDTTKIEGTTFRAMWASQYVCWHSMGGTYVNRSDNGTDQVKTADSYWDSYGAGPYYEAGITNKNEDFGGQFAHTSSWCGEHTAAHDMYHEVEGYVDDCETYLRNSIWTSETEYIPIASTPVRTGYVFMGWFFDPYCSVPLTEFEIGIQPGRHYYAGWEAEDVIIYYYDTREGTGLIGEQHVLYGDKVNLLPAVQSTSGWESVGWTMTPNYDGTEGEIIDDSILYWQADPGRSYNDEGRVGAAGEKYLFLEQLLDAGSCVYYDPTGCAYNDPAYTGTWEDGGHWEVKLYADYTINTTEYTVEIHWDDYKNNDGCRPQELTVGLISSVGNALCGTYTFTSAEHGSSTDTWSYTFTDLPISVSDSNTDIINYSFCVLGYVDANGNEGVIKDTQASTGQMFMTTPTNTSTDASTSYTYNIALYDWHDDGSEHFYTNTNDGNTTLASSDQSVTYTPYEGVLYMTHDLILTGNDIVFTIEWDDDSNRDGTRPEFVMLQLFAKTQDGGYTMVTTGQDTLAGNSQEGTVAVTEGMCDVSDDGNTWVYTFKDYQKYTNEGDLVIYGFSVNRNYLTDGYSTIYMDNNTTGPDTNGVTLKYDVKTATVPVAINWHDNKNQDGLRPASVTVQLIAYQWNADLGSYESVVVDTMTLSQNSTAEVWQSSFANEYVYHDGMPVTYRLAVSSDLNGNIDDYSNGYTWTEGIVGSPYLDGIRPSVDIYHNADEKSVIATVQWDDNYNNDEFRPDSVILQLYSHAPGEASVPVEGEEYRVNLTGDPTALTWTYTFENLEIYDPDQSGVELIYTVRVESARGGELTDYTAWYLNSNNTFVNSFNASSEPFVLLEYTPKVDTVNGVIYWQDESNRDGERAEFVDVKLMAHVYDETTGSWIDYVAASQTVTPATDTRNIMTADEWYFEFADMPVYRDTYPITYYLEVTSDLNGNISETAKTYNWEEKARGNMHEDEDLEVSVTIYQRLEVLNVTATVEWNDDNNNDNLRPNAIVLQLYADNVRVEGEAYTVTLYGEPTVDTWTHTFENLPRYEEGDSGDEITYTIYAAELTEGSIYGEYEDTAITGEVYTFPKYVASYKTAVDGQYSEDLEDSVEAYVKLTHPNNEMDVPISIIWQDENNRDGQRPDYVTVRLMAYQWNEGLATWEYKEVATKTIKSDDVNHMTASEWTDTFGYHEMYHDGVKIIYHLQVTSNLNEFIPEGSFEYGWVESAYGNQTEAIPQVIISQNTNTTTVEATIYWDDSQNNDNIRPTNVIVQLYSHVMGETPEEVPGIAYRVNLTGDPTADNWYYTFSGMPRFAEGHSGVELIYTIKVIEAEGEPLYGYYIIDANGEEEEVLRYEASYLMETGPETNETVNTTDFNESDRAYVRLEHITETKTMNFSVNWHDDDNRDNVRPDDISVDLYKTIGNGEPIYLQTIVITENAQGTWTYKITGLDGYEDGQPVKYTIEVPDDIKSELESIGYTTSTQDNIVHLYYTPETGSISTKLYWVDDEDNDGYRVDSVIATLYKNGVSTGKTIDLNETNDWSGTWTDLDVHYIDGTATGTDVVYNVVVEAPNGYTVSYNPESTTIEENEILYIQLTHEADLADVPVTVYWNDNSDNDGKRPDELKVMLLVDGEESYYTTVMTAENATTGSSNIWTYTFENLPVYRGDGEKIYYSVIVYDDATWEGEYDSLTTGTTLYLSHDMAMSTMYVSFQFNDNNNADGERPTGLYLQLTADGIPVDDSEYKHTVSFDTNVDGYTWNFGNLPVYKTDGTKIKYNVEVTFDEALGATDYSIWKSSDIELSESGDAAVNQIIVRLTKEANTTTHTGYIYWFDCNDLFGDRPDSLTLALQNNYSDTSVPYVVNAATGEVTNRSTGKVVGAVTVNEWTGDASVWTYTVSDLAENYINSAGQSAPIYYWVKANTTSIAQYYPTVFTGEDYGMDVALTHRYYEDYADAAAQDYTVNLMWLDNSDAWGYRPDSNGVKLNLMANGELYDTRYLTSADAVNGNGNAWSYTWKDLPTYRGGAGIVWTVEAADVDAYTQEQTIETATATTLTYFQSVGFNFTVNWDDSDNDDAVRPGNVVLNVFADGTQVGSVTMTGTENTWAGSISDLAVWRESDGDAAVQYTFQWADATAEYLSEIGYTAAPTLNGAAVEASNFYYLSASAFGDNTDAGYDVLDGTYEWETTLSYDKEIADYYFDVTFVDDVDRDGLRPSEMTVNLLADGVVIDSKVLEVNKTDSMYTVIWEDLEVWESGEAINYTIELPAIPSGYTAEYNNLHTDVTLTHDIILVDVTCTVNWDDATQLVDVFNAEGTYVRSYEQIVRTDVYVQLYADGVALGEPVFIGADTYGEGENLNKSASTTWADLYKYRDNGVEIVYTMEVYSDELQALLDDGHSMAYDFETKYEPAATITHDLYDIRGTVYYMYTYSEDFLLEGVPVTAYLQDTESGEYNAVASTITDENGTFEFLNLEQGLYIIRATYVYGEQTLAGTQGVELDRKDNNDNIIIVNRGAVNDSDYYQYTASGTAFYQTDATDDSTITPVPEDSVVLLYKVVDGQTNPEYIGMTQTDANGRYAFGGLTSAEYIVNVVFNYEGGVYTYDNGDALNDGLSFVISGADVAWPDIIKQVNDETDINDPEYNEPTPEEPDEPIPCVVNGYVFYADNGVHTTDPIEGVDVYVYVAETNVEVGKDTTDENGYWEVEGLPKGDYIAVYSYQGNASRVLLFTITNDDYNNGTYTAAPQYFDRQVEVPTGTIRGIVLDENGDATRALVAIYNDLGELQDFAYTDSFGFYEFTVTAGYDYNVRILAVEDEVKTLTAGDPDDSLTTLDYYVLSGTFHVDGIAQGNKLVAVYYETDGEYELITATLTDADGNFNVTVYEEGNYRVCPYINGEIFEVRNVSVGYQEERPQVTQAINGTYTVTGTEDYASLVLYKIVDSSVEKTVKTVDTAGSTYKLLNLDAGEYRLKLVDSEGNETWYYFTAPEGALVDVTYYVTISGSVLDENGNAIVGANVAVYDSNGELVGPETTILSDGGYSYSDLIEGEYTIVISSPNTTETLANKWTYEDDSYGNAYPNGMESDKEWVWNINAYLVTGKVTDQHGEPFAGAYVTFQDMLDTERQYVAITDENGEYKIGLASGAYALTSEYFWDMEHSYEGTGYTYVDLNGDMKNVNFTIYRHGLTIETVRKADGMIAPNADVSVYFSDGTLYWSGQTDENGQVTIDAFIGDYLIKGSYDGSKAVTTTATVTEDTTVVLELDSVVYITGTVFDANGEAVADGLVYYDNGEAFSGYVYTDDNGQYSIPVISADLGTFTLYATSGVSVGESVTIAVASDVIVDLTVDVAEATYTISGIVTDESGNRLADALVTMMWGNDKTNKVTTSTNSLGEYTFEVEDGTYYLTAEYEASNGNSYVTNAEYAVHVNGADVTQNLLVLMRYNVTVTVVDANGEIVPAATVHYTGAESGTDVTGEDGTVVLYLANGNYRFYASTESRTSKTVTVVVDGETNVELTLTNVGIAYEEPDVYPNELKIWGYVYNPDGWVVEGAEVELYKQDLETLEWNLVETKLTDAEGYYEFTGLDEGTYRVDSVYTYTTDCEVIDDAIVVDGYLTDAQGNPLSNNVVELYNEITGDLIATVYTEDDGYYRFDNVDRNVTYRLYAVDATGEVIVDGAVTGTYTDYTIEDTVTDIAGNVVVGAQVIIKDNEGNIVTTTITDDTGYYKVIVEDNLKTYTATVTYPASYEVDTETYQRDTTDRNAPYLMDSWYTIEGYVHDDDGNLVEGAIVILKDVTNTEIDRYVTEEDGYYIFDGLEDGIYYVEIVYNDATEHIYEIDAETGGVTDVTPEPEEPEPTNINVVITNFSTGTVIEPENGWVEGYNEFIVDSALVCAVYMRNENDVLTKLFCEVAADGSYVFSGEFLEGDEIVVVTKGDADLDGYVTITDMARINQYLVGIYQLDEIQKLAAEADGDGYITITDMARINQYLVGLYSFSWDTF